METQRLQKQPNRTRKIRSNTSLDDLPEDILHHIISFLPLDDAINSSAIARSWRNLWKSVPITTLYFDMNTFVSKIPPKYSTSENVRKLCGNFFRAVHHRYALKKIKFIHGSTDSQLDITRLLMSFVKAAKVVELELCYPHFAPTECSLFSGLRGSSVEVLKLHGINLLDPNYLIHGFHHQFDSVRELHLEDFLITDKGIEALMASCVNLEILSLVTASSDGLKCRSSDGFSLKKLKIVSRKLKHLNLHCFNRKPVSVKIRAPNLLTMYYRSVYSYKSIASKKSSSSSGEAEVILKCTRNQLDFDYCTNLVSCLSGVEDCFTIQKLWPCPGCLEDMTDIVFEVPQLRLVEMKAFGATKIEMCIVDLLKKHGIVLEKIVAYSKQVNGKSPPPLFLFDVLRPE